MRKKNVAKSSLYLCRSLFGQSTLVGESLWFVLLAFARLEIVFPCGSLAFVLDLFFVFCFLFPFLLVFNLFSSFKGFVPRKFCLTKTTGIYQASERKIGGKRSPTLANAFARVWRSLKRERGNTSPLRVPASPMLKNTEI